MNTQGGWWRALRASAAEAGLWFGVLFVAGFCLVWGIRRGTDLATVAVGVATLLIGAITLHYVIPQKARLLVVAQPELELTDLIFFLYDDQPSGLVQVPRDYLLQMNVAVINTGGRKAVLSKLRLVAFLAADETEQFLPDVPMPLEGWAFSARQSWTPAQGEMFQAESVAPPFVLEPDDVITLHFRSRRGVVWGNARWTPEALKELAAALTKPIVKAQVVATYRSRADVVTDEFVIAVGVEQQELYVRRLHEVTAGFTDTPDVRMAQFPFE